MRRAALVCGKKVRHRNVRLALRAFIRMTSDGGLHGDLSIFPCRHCGGFHIGHKTVQRRQGRAMEKSGARLVRKWIEETPAKPQ